MRRSPATWRPSCSATPPPRGPRWAMRRRATASLPLPDTLLLNGGVFRAGPIAQRLEEHLARWRGAPLRCSTTMPPTCRRPWRGGLGLARSGQRPAIGGGSARSYFLLLDDGGDARRGVRCPAAPRPPRRHLPGRSFALRLGRRCVSSSSRRWATRPGRPASWSRPRRRLCPPAAHCHRAARRRGRRPRRGGAADRHDDRGRHLEMHCVSADDLPALAAGLPAARRVGWPAPSPRPPNTCAGGRARRDRGSSAAVAGRWTPARCAACAPASNACSNAPEDWDLPLRGPFDALMERAGRRRRPPNTSDLAQPGWLHPAPRPRRGPSTSGASSNCWACSARASSTSRRGATGPSGGRCGGAAAGVRLRPPSWRSPRCWPATWKPWSRRQAQPRPRVLRRHGAPRRVPRESTGDAPHRGRQVAAGTPPAPGREDAHLVGPGPRRRPPAAVWQRPHGGAGRDRRRLAWRRSSPSTGSASNRPPRRRPDRPPHRRPRPDLPPDAPARQRGAPPHREPGASESWIALVRDGGRLDDADQRAAASARPRPRAAADRLAPGPGRSGRKTLDPPSRSPNLDDRAPTPRGAATPKRRPFTRAQAICEHARAPDSPMVTANLDKPAVIHTDARPPGAPP